MSKHLAECVRILATLADLFPDKPFPPESCKAYAQALADIPAEELRLAVRGCIATSRWFPTVADIRAEWARRHSSCPAPEVAWGEVCSERRRVGHCGAPKFSSPLIGRAVHAVGGWFTLAMAEHDADVMHRARFVDAYRSLLDGTRRNAQLGVDLGGQLPSEAGAIVRGLADTLKTRQRAPGEAKALAPPNPGGGKAEPATGALIVSNAGGRVEGPNG